MKLVIGGSGVLAGLLFAFVAAPVLADKADPPNAAPNVRSEFSRDHSGGPPTIGGMSMSEHVQSYPGNGSSANAPSSSKANDAARDNPGRD